MSFSRFLLRLGDFLLTLPVVIMKPDELIEFSRQTYARKINIESFSESNFVDSGLSRDELELMAEIPRASGKLLLLGVGGGREAIPLSRMGFEITGVDFIHELVQKAKDYMSHHNLEFVGLIQEISELDVPQASFDIVWLSTGMYSCVPSQEKRIELVRRIAQALRPGGYFLCQFQIARQNFQSGKGEGLRTFLSYWPFFNHAYENGDTLYARGEFIHLFSSEEIIRKEFEEGGLSVKFIEFNQTASRGGAICQKELLFF